MWDDGKEVCCLWYWQLGFWSQITQIQNYYYLEPRNILHEYAYSESKDKNSWYYGDLHKLKIILDPVSSITTIQHNDDGICIYYQGQCHKSLWPFCQIISMVRPKWWLHLNSKEIWPTGKWQNDPAEVARAVQGSNIAAIIDSNRPAQYRVYYQDPELHLKDCYYDTSVNRWVPGEQSSWIMSIDQIKGIIDFQVTSTLVYSHRVPP